MRSFHKPTEIPTSKITKLQRNRPKNLPLKSLLHEPLKFFFKIKAAKGARNSPFTEPLVFRPQGRDYFFSMNWVCSPGIWLTDLSQENRSARLLKQKEFIAFWKQLLSSLCWSTSRRKVKHFFLLCSFFISFRPCHTDAFSKVGVSLSSKFYIYDRIDTNFMATQLRMHFYW